MHQKEPSAHPSRKETSSNDAYGSYHECLIIALRLICTEPPFLFGSISVTIFKMSINHCESASNMNTRTCPAFTGRCSNCPMTGNSTCTVLSGSAVKQMFNCLVDWESSVTPRDLVSACNASGAQKTFFEAYSYEVILTNHL